MNHTTELIDFTELPTSVAGFSKLYVDYLHDFSKLHRYYESDFHSLQNVQRHIEQRQLQFSHRTQLVEILSEQNRQYGAPEKTFEHISKLGDETTFAVVTGQQVGMLGGPLYTIYKVITTIKLAQNLQNLFPQYNFVPIFWLEGEDHDYDEIKVVGILNTEQSAVHIDYLLDGKPQEKNLGPVGELTVDHHIQTFFGVLQQQLQNSEFKPSLFQLLRETYASEMTLNSAFAKLLNKLFDNEGLVFISSNNKQLKQILSPVFQKEIQEYPKVTQLIIHHSAELEDAYHAQIKPKALNLFLFHKGGRYMIEPREHDFSLKGTRHYMTKEELLRIAVEQPELLSPNVALRPICQDTLLPTVAYVGGPSEIAYFAQLKPIYRHFQLTMPMIYPRASATILESRVEKILEKYELSLAEFFTAHERIHRKVMEMISEVKIDEMFANAEQRVGDIFNEMKFGVNYIDSTLMGPLETTREKIESHLRLLKEKVVQAQERKHEVALRQIAKAAHALFPNGNFQERELNIVYFLNKYGMDFMTHLKDEIQIDLFHHQVIRI